MNELALTESASLREQYADRVEVLDRVKKLRQLKGTDHVTVEIVADYYEVPIETIKSTIKNNRAELTKNGLHVLRGREARSFADLAGLSSAITQIALFPRRAVLNVGQLLRGSDVAKAVRTALLDAEERDAGLVPAQASGLPGDYEEALAALLVKVRREKALEADNQKLTARAEIAERKFEEFEGGPGITLTKFHKKYFSEVPARVFFEHLYSRGYLIDQRGMGAWDEKNQSYKDGPQHFEPGFKGKPFLYLHEAGIFRKKRRFKTLVRPGDPELNFKHRLVADGLRGNAHTTDYLFAIEGGR
ncbi:hypothetical protein [Streptosporangium sp. CA-115845]|uniref:hypothetical protein n=1 Tax=Streptosporangium sp. CA-115845 TaxID=3240071 RepID=UPI003D91764F